MDIDNAVTALAALAQNSRLAVFRHLVALGHEGAFPGELIEYLDIPGNTLSFHLKTLSHAGLVTTEQQGRNIRYRADIDRMDALIGFLRDHCCSGQPELCAPAACEPASKKAAKR